MLGAVLPNHTLFANVPCVVRCVQEPFQGGLAFGKPVAARDPDLDKERRPF